MSHSNWHSRAVESTIMSASSMVFNPFGLESPWYEVYKQELDQIFVTKTRTNGDGHYSISTTPQYCLLPAVAGANPHHRGALVPDFMVFWTTFTSHGYTALRRKIPIVVVEGKPPPQNGTMATAFSTCKRQVFQQVHLAFAYPTAGGPRVIYAIACVGTCWKWFRFTNDPGLQLNASTTDDITYIMNTR
ncbi:hypothetical protein PILCRDRAFT_592777 [Piloderma croceum F 1598]|uniref:Uncharacterized protein n=1 Tax=Piloderma croceum (strain F 1598) TaxID=765440 RepID=A0A0C3F168_PILCF|nr:hypothetical protein PILCRDRAFT_592777 [Piloderma croceum F 1598]